MAHPLALDRQHAHFEWLPAVGCRTTASCAITAISRDERTANHGHDQNYRVTDRHALLPVIIVLTGEASDKITVDEYTFKSTTTLTTQEQQQAWSDLKAVFKASNARITQARDKIGFLPLTALPSLDPSLSVVQLPGGDYRSAASQLFTNINLRRLGLGGRSALRLTAPTGAQQLNFRRAYKLPDPARNMHAREHDPFEESVLGLVQLVQHALSLFGLGPVTSHATTNTNSTLQTSVATPLARQVLNALNTTPAATSSQPYEPVLEQGDGLLCDMTLDALAIFKEEFAGPILHVPVIDQSTMSSALLSALLSLVIGTKAKMLALGASGIPRDPFNRREKFLRAVRAFQHSFRISPTSSTLTRSFLLALGTTYSRTRGDSGGGAKAKVSRALRERIDAGLSTLGAATSGASGTAGVGSASGNIGIKDDEGGSVAGGATSSLAGTSGKTLSVEDVETSNLETFLHEVARGGAGRSVARLWGLRESRRDRMEGERELDGGGGGGGGGIVRDSLRLRRKRKDYANGKGAGADQDMTDGDGTEPGGGATTSDGESTSHGFGRGVLKGVKQRAGRAGRLLGDNLGFTESHFATVSNASHRDLSKLAPSITISSDKSNSRQGSVDVDSNASRSGSLATRLASALTTDASLTASVRHRLSPSPHLRSRLSSFDGGEEAQANEAPDGGPRVQMPRRVVSDMQGELPTLATLGSAIDLDGHDGESSRRHRHATRTIHDVRLERRHTINILYDAPEPSQILSRKRLVLDVNLRSMCFKLRQREQELADMVHALQTILNSFDQAISSIEPLVLQKSKHLSTLSESSSRLTTHAESYSQPHSSVSKLSIGTSRLSYAQSVVDEKLVDVVDFDKLLRSKVSGGGGGGGGSGGREDHDNGGSGQEQQQGTISKGVEALSRKDSGLRTLVSSLDGWKTWFGWGPGRQSST
ncbi:hypothetical protein ACM66B_005538 [Microbotryomycetes sp. NB124-2]